MPLARHHSLYGTGLRWMSYHPVPDDLVQATRWVTVCYIPLIPLERWLCRYAGQDVNLATAQHELATPLLQKLETIPLTLNSILSTLGWALVTGMLLLGPIGFLIWWTKGRAATPLEIILIFACIILTGLFPFWYAHRERALLEASLGHDYADACQQQRLQQREYLRQQWQRDHYFPLWTYLIPALAAFWATEELTNLLGWNNKEAKALVWVVLVLLMGLPVYWLDRYLRKQRETHE